MLQKIFKKTFSSVLNRVSPIVTVQNLKTFKDIDYKRSNIKFVCTTYVRQNEDIKKQTLFFNERIPGAVFFDIDKISDLSINIPHMLPDSKQFSEAMEELDLSHQDKIICYDDKGIYGSCRVYWTLKLFGHQNVWLLNGGLPAWQRAQFALETGEYKPQQHRNLSKEAYSYNKNYNLVVDFQQMLQKSQEITQNKLKDWEIVDTRFSEKFNGNLEKKLLPNMTKENIPGSKNLPFNLLINEKQELKPKEQLIEVLHQAGVDLNKNIIATCQSGMTACMLYSALEVVGHKQKKAVYDGSWQEFSQNLEKMTKQDQLQSHQFAQNEQLL